ncbi:DNA topoisomerase 1 (plasmid) [Vibrio nigripulchritudo]|uniref:type IA DNA topoisomerase n=1 Tax=Vibrio nigripulchritudo TaxID=28173 RepID=UPI00190DA2BA|nr:type IA DNA topoisomerase [Vibrio nigripulchritudo]BCL74093.1 DNA topoisomerase 1 [Vibrio nigripulchritudo]BDU35468.1 DNA topoisomerase 1 [Vibrio nigripulchritudo]
MNTLMIVESPNKIKTITKALPPGIKVSASVGHICDLPVDQLGVNPDFSPIYTVTKPDVLKKLTDLARNKKVVLFTDIDREGEAIAEHLRRELKLGENYVRIATNDLSVRGIEKAFNNPRKIDPRLVSAQEARRVIDRLVGYKVSQFANKVLGCPSAGRVQSVAVMLVVMRHKERLNHKKKPYLELFAKLSSSMGELWEAKLCTDTLISSGKFNDVITDSHDKANSKRIQSVNLMEVIRNSVFKLGKLAVLNANTKPTLSNAPAPFTTSTLLQEASTNLSWSAKQTTEVAQSLFEAGKITYHRTDNPNFEADSLKIIRDYISKWEGHYGFKGYLPESPNRFSASESAQAGHEAIRPTNFSTDVSDLNDDQKKLYKLIFGQAVASQMSPARFNSTEIILKAGFEVRGVPIIFKAKGLVPVFDGWKVMKIGNERLDKNKGKDLPLLQIGDDVKVVGLDLQKKTTKPPSKYTEATLIKKLDKLGIGRPSTFKSTIEIIKKRAYIKIRDRAIDPTESGISLVDGLCPHFKFMDVKFTSNLESQLDRIASGRSNYSQVVKGINDLLESELGGMLESNKNRAKALLCPKCQNKTLLKGGSQKASWSCLTCDSWYPDINGKPDTSYSPPILTDHDCPSCSAKLKLQGKKSVQFQRYFYCSSNCGFRCCSTIESLRNDQPRPDFTDWYLDNKFDCPCCGKSKLKRKKRKGKDTFFWVCDNCSTFIDDKVGLSKPEPNIDAYFRKKGS